MRAKATKFLQLDSVDVEIRNLIFYLSNNVASYTIENVSKIVDVYEWYLVSLW